MNRPHIYRRRGRSTPSTRSVLVAVLIGAYLTGHGLILNAEDHPAAASLGPAEVSGKAPLTEVARKVWLSILAVGTYDVRQQPSIRYFGTAFVVADGNTAVTNAHVIQEIVRQGGLEKLRVFLPQQVSLKPQPIDVRAARLLAQDEFHDTALLRFDGPAVPAVSLEPQLAEPGQAVAVVGYPVGVVQGLLPAVHSGTISALVPAARPAPSGTRLGAHVSRVLSEAYLIYQLDLLIFPGHSGSPLLDVSDGRVLGIINKTLGWRSREYLLSQPTAIGYAVPSVWVLRLLERSGIRDSSRPAESLDEVPGDRKTSTTPPRTAGADGE